MKKGQTSLFDSGLGSAGPNTPSPGARVIRATLRAMGRAFELPAIDRNELFSRLAEGSAARVTVVTPNRRLAAALTRGFDDAQQSCGKTAWEAADILPLPAFVARCYEDALYSDLGADIPLLLAPEQEQALWEEIVGATEAGGALLAPAQAAAQAREAWQLVHAWRLAGRLKSFALADDARAFADWAWRYEGYTGRDRHTDAARLPDVIATLLAEPAVRKPAVLVAYAFDIVTTQEREFFEALGAAGTALRESRPAARASRAARLPCASSKEEIVAAARWVRARLEADPQARIGVVVPDLAGLRRRIAREFAHILEPGHALPGANTRALPFNISLGEPLADRALVHDALLLLELASQKPVDFPRASRIIRSPFVAGGATEMAARARFDAKLRERCDPTVALDVLSSALAPSAEGNSGCPILRQRLAALSETARSVSSGSMTPGRWARHFAALLDAVGFPGERALDSAEHQTLKKWHETIAAYAALERVASNSPFDAALAQLRRLASDTPFQPEAPQVPVQVLGVLESAGIEFDHLWVMGLTEECWPMPSRPNPFIPAGLQRQAGVPEASAQASLELDRRITQGWLAAADEVIFSHPVRDEDSELLPSRLIAPLPASDPRSIGLPEFPIYRDLLHRASSMERLPDDRAPGLDASIITAGGAAVFREQAACPFKALAIHRLGAAALVVPQPAYSAADRGRLLHAVLSLVWNAIGSKAALDDMSEGALAALLQDAAARALARLERERLVPAPGRLARLERERLVRIARQWLEVERSRGDFQVVACETVREIAFGGTRVRARLDRLDHLGGQRHVVLDYKTGKADAADWLGPRPNEPQLPLYALAVQGNEGMDVCAVAFARVRAGDMGFAGIGRDAGLLPGVVKIEDSKARLAQMYPSWESLLGGWKHELETLGREFAQGDARVEPKYRGRTCERCDLHAFCRVHERASWGPTEGEERRESD